MISWAEGAFEKSLNQPMLPLGIIVVNALEFNEKVIPYTKNHLRWPSVMILRY